MMKAGWWDVSATRLASVSWRKAVMLACLVGLVLATNTRAQEWTGWRGPNRDGIVQIAGPADGSAGHRYCGGETAP